MASTGKVPPSQAALMEERIWMLELVSRIVVIAASMITLALFCAIAYCVFNVPTKMGRYRYFVYAQTVWLLVFHCCHVFQQPIFLPPAVALYSSGLGRRFGATQQFGAFLFTCFVVFSGYISGSAGYIYRYIDTFKPQKSTPHNVIFIVSIVLVVISATLCTLIFFLVGPISHDAFVATVINADAELAFFAEKSSLISFPHDLSVRLFVPLFIVCDIVIVCLFVICIILMVRIYVLKKSVLAARIVHFHRILLMYNLIQIGCVAFLAFLPCSIIAFSMIFRLKRCIVAVNMVSLVLYWHGAAQYAITLYAIVPYRKRVKWFCRTLALRVTHVT